MFENKRLVPNYSEVIFSLSSARFSNTPSLRIYESSTPITEASQAEQARNFVAGFNLMKLLLDQVSINSRNYLALVTVSVLLLSGKDSLVLRVRSDYSQLSGPPSRAWSFLPVRIS